MSVYLRVGDNQAIGTSHIIAAGQELPEQNNQRLRRSCEARVGEAGSPFCSKGGVVQSIPDNMVWQSR